MHKTPASTSGVARAAVFVVLVSAIDVLGAHAQGSVFASIAGHVSDATGAMVADATVALVRLDTNERREAMADSAGRYVFTRLVPGEYRLEVEKSGFRRTTVEPVVLSVNDAITRNLQLEAGDLKETIVVTAAAGTVQTRSAAVSLAADALTISELPLNGRDWSRLVALAPGSGLAASNGSISGSRSPFNNFTIDGVGNNNERSSGQPLSGGAAAFSGPNFISTDAIQEFRVITSNADATFGRGSGAQINLITKSGTNRLQGSAYEFMRDDALDARDFFNHGPYLDDQRRALVPPFSQHLFGGTAGGPLQRDRHFLFLSYEGFRQERQATSAFTFPNSDLIGLIPGDLGRLYRAFYLDRGLVQTSSGPGEFRPLTAVDRSAAIAAGFDPRLFDGNPANGEAGTLLQSAAVPQDVDQNALLLRSDHVLRSGWRASGRFGYTKMVQIGPTFDLASPLETANETRRWRSIVGEVVGVLSPSQVIEARGGHMRTEFGQPPHDGVPEAVRSLGVRDDLGIIVNPTGTGMNSVGLLGTSSFMDNQSIAQASLLHTWQRNRVTLRSGLDITSFLIDIHNGAGRPSYTFTGFVGSNGLLGAGPAQGVPVATSAAASIFGVGGGPTSALRQFTSSRQEYFAQADYQVTRTLTLNLGMRYAYFGVYEESSNAIANLYAVDASGAVQKDVHPFALGRTANRLEPIGDQMYAPDKNNWQPRVGVVWDASGRGTTAFRGAYGAYDDRFFQLVFSAQGGLVNNPPFTLASNAANVPFVLGGPLPVVTGTPSVFGVDPTLRNARVHRVNAGVEHQVWDGLNVTADYVGAFGRGLFGVVDVNGGAGVPRDLRPDPRFSTMRLIGNTSSSDYHALQASARQLLRGGVSFSAAYTLADAKDDSSAESFAIFPGLVNAGASAAPGFQGGGAQAWVDRPRDADWGATAGVSRHTLVASHVVELPGAWSVAGILSLRSGEPVSLALGADANDDGDTTDRPALLSGQLDDLYNADDAKTQFLLPRDRAIQLLGAASAASDPFAVVPRNALMGPWIWYYDMSVVKRLQLSSRARLSLEINAFNLFNRTNFGAPIATLSDARFGRIVSTAVGTTPRQIQLGARVSF
jgi:Carboxypeptidase regulatory-like domain